MMNAEEATKKFMEDLESGKLKRDKVPNPPPYYDGNNEHILKDFEKILKSDLGKFIKNLE